MQGQTGSQGDVGAPGLAGIPGLPGPPAPLPTIITRKQFFTEAGPLDFVVPSGVTWLVEVEGVPVNKQIIQVRINPGKPQMAAMGLFLLHTVRLCKTIKSCANYKCKRSENKPR